MSLSRQELSGAGKRFTRQRDLIMGIIRQGHGHLDAGEIYRRAREKEPRLSLSTVYRTLRMMKELNLVDELHFGEDHHHYEEKPPREHYHLVCLNCGRVIEFSYPLARLLKKEVPEARDFSISETEMRIAGYCAKCRRARASIALSER